MLRDDHPDEPTTYDQALDLLLLADAEERDADLVLEAEVLGLEDGDPAYLPQAGRVGPCAPTGRRR